MSKMGDRRTDPCRSVDRGHERLTLIKHSLLSAIYQNRHEKVEIGQLLNRFFALIQDHVVIVVLDRQESRYKVIYHTMFDPVWKDAFEETLCNAGKLENDHIYWDKQYSEENSYILHNSKRFAFYFADFSCGEGKELYGPPVFKLCSREQLEKYFIPDFLNEFENDETSLHELYLSEKLNERFQDRERYWEKGHYNARKFYAEDVRHLDSLIKFGEFLPEVRDAVKDTYPEWPRDFFVSQQQKISGIFEKAFDDFKDSPLLFKNSPNANKPLVNVVFSARSFTSENMRYRGKSDNPYYAYETRTYMPEDQKKQLYNAFKYLRKEGIPESRRFNGYDQFFWDYLEKGEIEEIFRIIESPEGETARALSDMVYTSGFVRITDSPFRTKGHNRLDYGVWQQAQKGKLTDDYKRLVCHHYVGCVMGSTAHQISAFLVPVQVSGSSWGCLAFFYDPDKGHECWVDNFHYYFSLSDHMFSNIRSQLKILYLESIEELYGHLIGYFLDGEGKEKILHDRYIFAKAFNQCSNMIARIYPYDLVVLGESSFVEFDAHYIVGNRYELPVQLNENPFFTKRISKSFVEFKDIAMAFMQAEYIRALRLKLDDPAKVIDLSSHDPEE